MTLLQIIRNGRDRCTPALATTFLVCCSVQPTSAEPSFLPVASHAATISGAIVRQSAAQEHASGDILIFTWDDMKIPA